ncbi:MAG: 4Fe-4S dicluster domain-containing protein [Fimbriimonas sp.]|nr:4Fe-4S dicluster domain-containing protein [Fimbriimonas sp.]
MDRNFYIDPSRCIGCNACVMACAECGTHSGASMIHLEEIQRGDTVQTTPIICMHCEDPACAAVCPSDAIKKTPDGVVQSSLKPRCIGCTNCVYACPFGVPKYDTSADQMMKCDMCYDRTSIGLRPMCATVCPSGALFFGTPEEIAEQRRSHPVNEFRFGTQVVRTKVFVMLPVHVPHMQVSTMAPIRKSDLLEKVNLVGLARNR